MALTSMEQWLFCGFPGNFHQPQSLYQLLLLLINTFSESYNMLSMNLLSFLRLKGNHWQNYHLPRLWNLLFKDRCWQIEWAGASCYWPPGKYNSRGMWPPHVEHLFIARRHAFVFLMYQVPHIWYILRATLMDFSKSRASSFKLKTLHVYIFRGL